MNDMTKSAFEAATITIDRGNGVEEYKIPANRVFGAIAAIEEHVTLKELSDGVARTGHVSLVRASRAYAAALRYAGCEKITDEEVYLAMFNNTSEGSGIVAALQGLLGLMIPPAAIQAAAKAAREDSGQPGE